MATNCVLVPFTSADTTMRNRVAVGRKELDGCHVEINFRTVTLGYEPVMGGGCDTLALGVSDMQYEFLRGKKCPSETSTVEALLKTALPFKVVTRTPATRVVLEYCGNVPGIDVCDRVDEAMLIGTVVCCDQPILRDDSLGLTRGAEFVVFVREIEGGMLITEDTKIEHVPGLCVQLE